MLWRELSFAGEFRSVKHGHLQAGFGGVITIIMHYYPLPRRRLLSCHSPLIFSPVAVEVGLYFFDPSMSSVSVCVEDKR
jgi:hypothetical protein